MSGGAQKNAPSLPSAEHSLPGHYEAGVDLAARPDVVFAHLDDFEQLGAHMMRSSRMMAGSRMRYFFDAGRGRSVGSRVRLTAHVFGLPLRVEEEVIERRIPSSKVWQTIGAPRMLVIAAYQMGFKLSEVNGGCRLRIFIRYALPAGAATHWLGALAGARYARWCVDSVLEEARGLWGELPGSVSTTR